MIALVALLAASLTANILAVLYINRRKTIMSALEDITAKVTACVTVMDSSVTLIQGLKSALDAAGTDPAKLADLSARLDAETQKLAAAVAANTPAAPPVAAPAPATP